MPYLEQRWSYTQVELLMDIAATLADLTHTVDTCGQIPAYLGKILDRDGISLALISEQPEPSVVFHGATPNLAGPGADLSAQLLSLYHQTKPLVAGDTPALRDGQEDLPHSETSLDQMGDYPRATVFARSLEGRHRMLLTVHQRREEAALTAGFVGLLSLVADELAKFLSALVLWQDRSEQVGPTFDRLTTREWAVLQGLMTERGEKHLADGLGLSPHTLHSHIKSIYRKLEVQGRLQLQAKVKCVIRDRRMARINTPREPAGQSLNRSASAAG